MVIGEYVFDLAGPAAMGTMFLLFPDGRVRRPHEGWVVRVFASGVVVLPVLLVLTHGVLPAPEYAASREALVASPLGLDAPDALGGVVVGLYHLGTQFGIIGAVLLVFRYRRLPARERAQTYWLLLAATTVLADVVLVQLLTGYGLLPESVRVTTFYAIWVPALVFVPVSILIALVRHRLFDVHLAVRRSLVYGATSAGIGLLSLVLATALGVTAGQRLPLVATVVVTIAVVLALAPVRRRLNRWADARVYGEQLSGTELLGHFGQTLEHAYDLDELGPRAAATIVDGLGLSWARLSLLLPGSDAAEVIGVAGPAPGDDAGSGTADLVLPLMDREETVGEIECGPPVRGGQLAAEERELLVTVARQTALAVRSAHFAAELAGQLDESRRQAEQLQQSRRRLVDAQDSERQRIERELHDGVQQQVVAVATLVRLALNQLNHDPAAARQTFEDARRAAAEILEELRGVVRGIRPPVLADHGLFAAVEARLDRLPLQVALEVPPGLRGQRFPPEIEAAAYFVVNEALTNVLKHAAAERVLLRMWTAGSSLHLVVEDDGAGFVAAESAGTGLTGLSDRVGAVGGSLRVASRPGEGTTVTASLPVPRSAHASR